MTDEQIKTEFKDFNLTQQEVDTIRAIYNNGAHLLTLVVGHEVLDDSKVLKLTLNSLKFTVTQILELRDGREN